MFGIVGGTACGLIKIIGGIITWHGPLILEGTWDIFSPVFGSIIIVSGIVHETTHAWQYQKTGNRYASDVLFLMPTGKIN